MSCITRRAVLKTAATIPFAVWYERFGLAQTPAFVRHEASTPEGQAALKTYAQAVAKMMADAEGSPVGWLFQWYTHSVRDDRQKSDEIGRVYSTSSPASSLAEEMWDTCQAHFDSNAQPFFLPWHRMYVYFFERIVRKVSGDASFALPYWNYSIADPATHAVMPAAFRRQTNPVFKSLFRADRNRPTGGQPRANVNAGEPIDRFAGAALGLAALKQGTYLPEGALMGFNVSIDGGLHGAVHVLVGNGGNMGSVPWAARDPIFWMHHCNIDRLWASWNHNGGVNPSAGPWLAKTFVFADENGNRVVAKVDDFKDLAPLGYSYDRLEPAPPDFHPLPPSQSDVPTAAAPPVFTTKAAVELGTTAVSASLSPAATGDAPTQAERAGALSQTRRAYLVLRHLKADSQPGVLYHVYLNLPSSVRPSGVNAFHAGTLSFFDTVQRMHPSGANDKFVSFDVTEILRNMQRAQPTMAPTPMITIAPVGQPAATAKPIVGEIVVVEQ